MEGMMEEEPVESEAKGAGLESPDSANDILVG